MTIANTTTTTTPKTAGKSKTANPKPAKGAKPVAAKKADPKPKAPALKELNSGLRTPQVRVLQALSKGNVMSRSQISEAGKVDQAALVEYIGSSDDNVRKVNDEKHFKSLVTLKYVKFAKPPEADAVGAYYEITAAGRQIVTKILAAYKAAGKTV